MVMHARTERKGKLVRDRVGTVGVEVERAVGLGRMGFPASGLARPRFSVFTRFGASAPSEPDPCAGISISMSHDTRVPPDDENLGLTLGWPLVKPPSYSSSGCK